MANEEINNPAAVSTGSVEQTVQGTDTSTEQPKERTDSVEDTFNGGKFDINKLPPEVLPVYKGMQSAYTKKTQEIADLRKELEEMKQSQLANSMTSEEETIPPEENLRSQEQSETFTEEQQEAIKILTPIISSEIERQVAGIRQQMQPLIQKSVDTEIKDFSTKYPDWRNYSKEITERVGKGMPLEEAYWAVAGSKAKEAGRKEAFAEMQTKKSNQTIQPGPSTDTVGAGGKMDFKESAEAAKRSLGRGV